MLVRLLQQEPHTCGAATVWSRWLSTPPLEVQIVDDGCLSRSSISASDLPHARRRSPSSTWRRAKASPTCVSAATSRAWFPTLPHSPKSPSSRWITNPGATAPSHPGTEHGMPPSARISSPRARAHVDELFRVARSRPSRANSAATAGSPSTSSRWRRCWPQRPSSPPLTLKTKSRLTIPPHPGSEHRMAPSVNPVCSHCRSARPTPA